MAGVWRSRKLWQIIAGLMLFLAVWLVLGDFFPTVWGLASEQIGVKYLVPIMLAVVALVVLVILYITNAKKSTTTSASSAKKTGEGSFLGSILVLVVFGALVVVVSLIGSGLYIRMAEGTGCGGQDSEPVRKCRAVLHGTAGSPTITIGKDQTATVTAEVTVADNLNQWLWEKIDGAMGNQSVDSEPIKIVNIYPRDGGFGFCYLVTSSEQYPENAHHWYTWLPVNGQARSQEIVPLKWHPWYNGGKGLTFAYYGGAVGTLYIKSVSNADIDKKGCSP